ncbi:MAG TPA: NAD(P)-dependent oxidoreductase [Pseudolabrys sp.]|nr:NAD(P)-dependent oxidoreductase [Pseudolabrys sp.]
MLTHRDQQPQAARRIVIVGARGFVGASLIAHCERSGTPFLAVGRTDFDLAADGAADRLAAVLDSEDTLILLSAITPDKGRGVPALLSNLQMGANVCAALERKPIRHVIYFSSDAVYPFTSALINEESCAEAQDLYATMHLTRELMLKQGPVKSLAILRPTLIYGAADTHNSYGPNRLRRMAHKQKRITLFGEGEETRDHIYIDDVVSLTDLVVRHGSVGTLNLASGRSVSFAELAKMVGGLFAKPVEIAGMPRQSPITHRSFDITAIYRAFPEFQFTPLERGLAIAHENDRIT